MMPQFLQATPVFTLLILCCLVGFQPMAKAQFLPAKNYPVGRIPFGLAIGDFNGDGIPDLAVANIGGTNIGSVSILLGNGDGTFKAAVDYDSGGNDIESVAVGDFNGDGKLDLAVLNEISTNSAFEARAQLDVLLGNGDGTFRRETSYIVGNIDTRIAFGFVVAAGDFNMDGKLDLVVTTSIGTFLFIGNGEGTFKATTTILSGYDAVLVADLNHDGKPDLAITNQNYNTVSISLGNGDGTFAPAVDYPTSYGPSSVAIGDFNRDGNPDLVVANAAGPDNGSGGTTVSVLFGNGDGTFQAPVSYPVGSEPFSIAVGDIDKDGKLDLIVTSYDAGEGDEIAFFRGNGDGTFQAPITFVVGTGPDYVALADLTRNGLLDVVTANFNSYDVSVLLNATPTACKVPPDISRVSADPDELWPPNGKFVDVHVRYTAISQCGGTPTCKLKVKSNEPSRRRDWIILDPHHVELRAEKSHDWFDDDRNRKYRITIRCTDPSGNSAKAHTTVTVGHRHHDDDDQ